MSDNAERTEPSEDYRLLRRRYLLATLSGALVAFGLFAVILQGGREGLLGRDLLGNFYDAQATAILEGHLDVPREVPGFEGFAVGDKTHIYQGLAPVLPRLPVVAVTDSLDGRLTGISMLCAYGVLLGYLVLAGWRARLLLRGTRALHSAEAVLTAVFTFGIGSGLVTFLAARAWVYHEAALWGVALALASLVHLAMWTESTWPRTSTGVTGRGMVRRPLLHAALATVFAGLAFNTRSSIGAGPLAALAVAVACTALSQLVERRGLRGRASALSRMLQRIWGFRTPDEPRNRSHIVGMAIIVVGALFFVAGYGVVNQARFGSLFGVPLEKQRLVENDPIRLDALEANDGSLFGLKYSPSVALQMLRPDAVALRSVFPYAGFPNQRPHVVGDVLFAENDWSTSIPSAVPLGFLAGLVGLCVLVAPRRSMGTEAEGAHARVSAWRLPVFGAGVSGATILIFGYMAQRYVVDFYPFAAVTSVLGLQWLALRLMDRGRPGEHRVLKWSLAVSMTVLSFVGAWVTSAVALQYQREIAPGFASVNRAGWLGLQTDLPGKLDPTHSQDATELGDGSQVGQVAIVGDCSVLYRWSGSRWNLIESGGGRDGRQTGARVRVSSSQPVSAASSPIVLLVGEDAGEPIELTLVGPTSDSPGGETRSDLVELRFTGGIQESWPFPITDTGEGFELDLDITQDPLTNELVVTRHGTNEQLVTQISGTAIRWETDTPLPPGIAVTVSPLTTPVCRDLEKRGD